MYDLILDIGCYCSCHCEKPLANVVNNQGFTPLTLAAKLARKEVIIHCAINPLGTLRSTMATVNENVTSKYNLALS